jgi:long-chain fatty acid transport protein
MKRPVPIFVALLGCCLPLARPARASSALELMGSPTGANALTARLFSRNASAAYFNPALLPDATPKLEAGFFYLTARTKIHLKERPAGADVPSTVYNSTLSGTMPPLATVDLPNPRSDTNASDSTLYAVLGIVRPLAGKYLVFGFYSLLPVNTFLDQKGFFPDEREQYFSNQLHFEQLGDRLKATSFAIALGSQLNDWLAIGAGIDIAVVTRSSMQVYMPDAGNQKRVLLDPDIRTNSKFKPYLGVIYRPWSRVTVAGTLHLGTSNDTNGENQVRMWKPKDDYDNGLNYIPQVYTLTQGNEPARLGLGIGLSSKWIVDERPLWEIGLMAVGERWSQYRDRHGETPAERWRDTVTLVAGGNFAWRQRRLAFDLGYAPSPVPHQNGRTNYVDNGRIMSSASIEAPVQLLGRDVAAGFYLFGTYFIPRTADKDPAKIVDEYPDTAIDVRTQLPATDTAGLQTNNPGYPGFNSRGYMLGLGVCLRIAR